MHSSKTEAEGFNDAANRDEGNVFWCQKKKKTRKNNVTKSKLDSSFGMKPVTSIIIISNQQHRLLSLSLLNGILMPSFAQMRILEHYQRREKKADKHW